MLESGRDPAIRRLARNALHLIGSNALQSVFNLVSSIIVARALGVHDFGVIALVGGYCLIVGQLLSFQSIYAVIQLGTNAREKGASSIYLGIIRVGLYLDIVAALSAAVVAVFGAWLALRWLHELVPLTETHVLIIAITAIGMLTEVAGAPTAILRMADRYDAFLWHAAISGSARLALTVTALLLGGGLLRFVVALTVAAVIANLTLLGLGLRELRRQRRAIATPTAGVRATLEAYPELPRTLITTNLTATMRMVRELDILVVGHLLDSASAGIFRIARQVGGVVHKLVDPFFHAIYPDLALSKEKYGARAVVRLVRTTSALLGFASLLVLLIFISFGQSLLGLVLGAEYAGAYLPAILVLIGAVVWSFGHPLSPALMVWGRHRAIFRVTSICSIAYISLVWFLTDLVGMAGAASAYAVFHTMWVATVAVLFVKQVRAS
jgi:O-antigen/teichoic acid export membrane protein